MVKGKLSSNWKIEPDYKIVEGDGFAKQAKKVFGSVERWEDLFSSYEWALKRDPKQFEFVHSISKGRLMKLRSANNPSYGLFFRVRKVKKVRQVVLKWVEEIPPEEFDYDRELFWDSSDS